MGFRRVYLWTGSAGIATIIGLFFYLQTLGLAISAEPVTYCNGNICESVITIRNPTGNDVDVYNKPQVQLDFTPKVKKFEFFVEDASCKLKKDGTLSKSSSGVACGKVGWRWLNFTDETKPRSDRVYVYRFAKYSSKRYLLRGEKNSLFDKVKWGMNIGNDSIDPIWITANHSISEGDSNTFKVENSFEMSVNDYYVPAGQVVNFNFTNNFAVSKNFTCSVESNIFLKEEVTKPVLKKVTKMVTTLVGDVSLNGTPTKKTISSLIVSTEFVNEVVETRKFAYDGRNWIGWDFSLNPANTTFFDFKLAVKNMRTDTEYSVLCNSSGVYADFDPIINGVEVPSAVFYSSYDKGFDDETDNPVTITAHNAPRINSTIFKIGNGSLFSTRNEFLRLPKIADATKMNITRNMTVTAWINTTDATGDYQSIIGESTPRTGCSPSCGFGLTLWSVNNRLSGQVADSNTSSTGIVNDGIMDVTANNWHFVTWIYDYTANNFTLKLDNNPATSVSTTPTQGNNHPAQVAITIGNQSGNQVVDTNQEAFMGHIDDVCIYDAALTSVQLDAIYNSGTGSACFVPIANGSLKLNGLERNLTYEFGTTATINASLNVTSNQVCIDVYASGYGRIGCGSGSYVTNVTWNVLREVAFNDSEQSKTFGSSSEFIIPLDNRTFLQNVSFNLTGLGNPENVTIYIQSNKSEAVFPGKLNGSVNVQNQFIYANKQYEIINLSFPAAGVQTIYANISTAGLARLRNFTDLRINVSGFAVDAGNDLDLLDNFSQSTYINFSRIINASTNLSIWEDFVVNKTGKNRFASTSSGCYVEEYRQGVGFVGSDDTFPDKNLTQLRCDVSNPGNLVYYVNEWDVRNFSRFDVAFYGFSAGSAGTGTWDAGFYDGSSFESVMGRISHTCAECGEGQTKENINLSFRKVTNSLTNWDVFVNDVLDHTETFTLPQGSTWHFGFKLASTITTSTSAVNIHTIFVNAIMPVKSPDGLRYNNTISVTSIPVDSTSNNITGAYCDYVDASVENYGGINVSCELSGNNGRDWVTAPLGERVLLNSNTTLLWRINCSMASYNDSCMIPQVRTRIISGSVSNLSFDFGSDGTNDYRIGGFFNQTNNSILIINSTESFMRYATSYCGSLSTCKVPVSISTGTGGIVQINSFNYSMNVNSVFVNKTLVDNITNMRFSVNFTFGSVRVDGIRADYRGTKSFGVSAVSTTVGANVSLNVTIRYSPFNLSLPSKVDFYEVFAPSRTTKNVTPRGQSNTIPIWNVTNLAYDTDINVSVRVNETLGNQSYNITWSLNNTKTSNFLLLNVSQYFTNITFNNSAGVWAWHDYNTTRRFIIDYFEFSSICSECFPTYDANSVNMITTD